jgi:hypothetical protein
MRAGVLTTIVVGLIFLPTAWTLAAATPTPPVCTAAQMKQGAVLSVPGGPHDSPRFTRMCGPGRAIVRLAGRSFAIRGGRCHEPRPGPRWVYFGLITNGPQSPRATGFSIVMDEGDRPGVVNVSDSIVQAAGLNLAPTGTTTVARDLRSGTFVLRSGEKRITGSWTCV